MSAGLTSLRSHTVRHLRPVLCGLAIVAALWTGVGLKLAADLRDGRHDADRTMQSFAMLFEENVLRSIGEIDKALLYLRHRIRYRAPTEDYGAIVNSTDILSEIMVQVAIIDANGIMRASNAGPVPKQALYLGDRPHFRAHVGRTDDALYISTPMVGRASGKASVQLSRRYLAPDGAFGGVVVGSLDPRYLTQFYDRIDLGVEAAVTLIGEDGIVRSSGGTGGGLAVGADLTRTELFARMRAADTATFDLDDVTRGVRRVTTHKVRGHPLFVSVDVARTDIDRDAWSALRVNVVAASVLTLLAVVAVLWLARIETKRREAEAHVNRLASEDPLTGLPNRRIFRATLEAAAAAARQPGGAPFALMFLDVDRFKLINDSLGHRMGDELLLEISRRIAGVATAGRTLARLGGDEFALLLPGLGDRAAVETIAQRIVGAMAVPVALGGHQASAGISIGIAMGPGDGVGADEFLVAADLALYAVKGSGRGTFRFYDPLMGESMSDRGQLERDLRLALERGELELHYQPSVAARTGRVAGFEALSRWHHPERGNIPPATFIAIAEESGLIHALGEWSLIEACRQAATWPADVKLAVNLSPVQFAGPDLVGMVSRVLRQTGLPATRLELELTEQMLLKNGERTHAILTELKALGVSIAMDDFGTGYSSLNYLRRFPFDRIKVDRSFVTELADGPQPAALVRAVVDIARSLGMKTTAEGVETPAQHLHLVALGCDEIQGYLFSRPVPASGIPALLAGWTEAWRAA